MTDRYALSVSATARPVDARRGSFCDSRLQNEGLFRLDSVSFSENTKKRRGPAIPHVAPASAQFTRGDRREECPRLTLGVRHRTTTVVPFFRRTLAAHCFARLESRALHGVVVEFVVVASARWEALDAAPPSPGTTSPGVSRGSSGAPEVGLEGQAREASRQPEKGRVRQHVCRRRRA